MWNGSGEYYRRYRVDTIMSTDGQRRTDGQGETSIRPFHFIERGYNDESIHGCMNTSHGLNVLTHWGRATHICVSKLTNIGTDNGLLPGRRQAIIWTNAGILLIGTLGTKFSEILIESHSFSFKKMHMKMSSGNWRPSCLGLNVLNLHMLRLFWLLFGV